MLVTEHLKKTFNPGTINEKTAIQDVSLALKDGDFVTVIGGNGAGKSTLLNLISGLYLPDKGRIIIDDHAIEKMSEHHRSRYIGRVFQDPMMGTCAEMTIEENLAMALRRGKRRNLCWGISEKERRFFKKQLAMLDLGLEDRLTTKVGLLSGGQRQAITLLMATMMLEPEAEESVEENLLFALYRGKRPFYHRHLTKKDITRLQWTGTDLKTIKKTKVKDLDDVDKNKLEKVMSQLSQPALLLLDEHTAALDPKTAKKVLEITNQLVTTNRLTTIMITHNMRDALAYGNRLWMMDHGQLILDIEGAKKSNLEVQDLMKLFENSLALSDRMLLS